MKVDCVTITSVVVVTTVNGIGDNTVTWIRMESIGARNNV